MIFMHISELCFRKGVREGGSAKNVTVNGKTYFNAYPLNG